MQISSPIVPSASELKVAHPVLSFKSWVFDHPEYGSVGSYNMWSLFFGNQLGNWGGLNPIPCSYNPGASFGFPI